MVCIGTAVRIHRFRLAVVIADRLPWQKGRAGIAHYTDVPVIGAVSHNPEMAITERHLGLIPSNEQQQAEKQINRIAQLINEQVDLDALINIAC